MNTLQHFSFTEPNGVGHPTVSETAVTMAKNSEIGKRKIGSPTHREEVLDFIAELDRRGYTQHEIRKRLPERFGFTLSQGDVCKKLAIIRGRYKSEIIASRHEKVNEQLAALRDVRRTAWDAYHLSMLDSEKEVVEWEAETAEVQGGDLESSERVIKRIQTREGRLPANQYLATILRTHEDERKLLGLDEEVHRNMMHVQEAEAVLRAVLEAQREVLADQPHLLHAVQQRCLALIPFMRGQQPTIDVTPQPTLGAAWERTEIEEPEDDR